MCGIAGTLVLDDRSRSAQSDPRDTLDRMLLSIFHRGPDEDGKLIDGELAMGMRRLSIIDLADGQQPIFNESGRYGVVFNGEIYNYVELREQLIAEGYCFKTKSDTEVIVHLFEKHGKRCVEHLRGMFAFAIWDNQKRELFIARDRLGIKPLYYTQASGSFVFGSEIKSLLEHPYVTASPDKQALSEYLSLKYVPAPRTMFEGISSLPPGHTLSISERQVEIDSYWDISYSDAYDWSEEDAVEELGRILRDSIRLRLRSDVPFGAFLSGGVDSSVIVALMSEAMRSPVKTFSVGFSGAEGQDELPYAQQVADRFGCEHHTLAIGASDFLEHCENVLWHLDQPIADQATVATHMVASLARKHVKMVLTGEGGDELFAGYARYAGEEFSPWIRRLPGATKHLMKFAARKLPGMRRGKIALNALAIADEATRFANWFPMFSDDMKAELLASSSIPSGGAGPIFAKHLRNCDASSPLDRMLYCDSKTWLPDYLLLRGDKLTMANSIEARVPLLDHKLVEFAATLPNHLKLNGKTRKYLLKQFARTLLPSSVIDRKKQGFPIPIEKWLRGEANPMLRDLLSPSTLAARGNFDTKYVAQLISQHETGFADRSTELWGLMSLEMWHRKFIDSPAATRASTQPDYAALTP